MDHVHLHTRGHLPVSCPVHCMKQNPTYWEAAIGSRSINATRKLKQQFFEMQI